MLGAEIFVFQLVGNFPGRLERALRTRPQSGAGHRFTGNPRQAVELPTDGFAHGCLLNADALQDGRYGTLILGEQRHEEMQRCNFGVAPIGRESHRFGERLLRLRVNLFNRIILLFRSANIYVFTF